jgi:cytochrome P450
VKDYELAKEILTDPKTYEKAQPITSNAFEKFVGRQHLVNVNGEQWKKQRKVLDPAFLNMNLYTKIFSEKTDLVIQQIKDQMVVENIHDLAQKLALDVLGKSIFGHDFNSINGSLQEDLTAYENIMGVLTPSKLIYQLFFQNIPFLKMNKMLKRSNEILDNLYEKLINEAKNKTDFSTNSMLDMMVQASISDKENSLSDTEIRDNISIFFLAGHET